MELPQHIPNPPGQQRPAARADAALGPAAAGDRPPVRSLYIHTPFCVHKCHYCDFYSFVDTRDRQEAFVERLIDELAWMAPAAAGAPLLTMFVGGGTPSLLRVDLWRRLLGALGSLFDLSLIRAGGPGDAHGAPEFTVECNPESTTAELLGVLREGGVNRVSIGAQSFDLRHLKSLERWHDPENVARAVELARGAGIARQSIDLIFAIPGQTIEDWDRDLDRALALNTTHLSCYNLTYEPNTAMTRRLRAGEFAPVDDDTETAMYERCLARLEAAGLRRYEVSNFAAPGCESRHNLAYWVQDQWLAAGPSASGHAWAGGAGTDMGRGSFRWKNVPRLGDYLGSGSGPSPIVDLEAPDPMRLVRERIMMGLRITSGLGAAEVLSAVERAAPARLTGLRRAAERLRDRGLLEIEGDHHRWRPTAAGMMMADAAAGELMRAAGTGA